MRKILLVENNEDNRDMLARRLTRQGFEVCSAVDGPAGVALASTESPDLILMDIALGPIDGWEATLLIKAAPATASRLLGKIKAASKPGGARPSLERRRPGKSPRR
jgi:CheY-like chemotaxis protein